MIEGNKLNLYSKEHIDLKLNLNPKKVLGQRSLIKNMGKN